MEHKSNRKNIIYTLVSQFLVLGLALVVPRFILVSYGSDTNGLIGTVSQVMAYLALLEAGIGRAARNELYKYLHGDIYDKENISVIMSLSRKTYRNITKIYALIILAFSFILPFIIKTDLDYWTVFAVVIIEGASGVVSFSFIQNWTDLLAVDGRNYVTSNIDLVYKFLIYLVKIVMAILGVNIIFMELGFFAATLIKLLISRKYMKSHYEWLDCSINTGDRKLKDKGSFMIAEVAWTVFSSTDMIVISIFCSTKNSSVYAIYYMVFISLNKLMDAVYTSLKFNLGQSFHNDKEQYKITHDLYNSVFLGTVSALMIVAYYLCIPFVSLYTKGITDVNYIDTTLPMAFSLIMILSWCRMVAEHLNGIAGYAKQLGKVSIIEAAINITLSVALVSHFGIRGVLYATVIALPLKIVYCNWLADKVILKRSMLKTILILSVNLLLFIVLAGIKGLFEITINSYLEFAVYGLVLTICAIILFTSVNIVLNRNMLSSLKRIAGKKLNAKK